MKYLLAKEKQGVTLIQLIITIIIMIIITSFALWYASNTSKEAKLARVYSEITTVKEAYEDAKILSEISEEAYNMEVLLTSASELNNKYSVSDIPFLSSITDDSELYLITPENAKELEIEKLTMDYVIDGKTGNVYIIEGFSRKDGQETVYEYKDILSLYRSTVK